MIPSFERVADNPVISPDPSSVFDCPMRGRSIHWEALHTFSPAAVVKDGKVYVLYRAEDDTGEMKIGAHTSRLGIAVSEDGIHFQREKEPVFFPADDGQKENEWDGGCEDPRIVETNDGSYVLTYTQWNRKQAHLAVATSRDLRNWTKHGPAFPGAQSVKYTKSGSIVCSFVDGRLVATKVNGKYLMYWGFHDIQLAVSNDLITWDPGTIVLPKRTGMFDSSVTEAGPPAVITRDGIVLLYNGSACVDHSAKKQNIYGAGCAIFDRNDPSRCIARSDDMFFKPEMPYEKTGQYLAGDIFFVGMVYFREKWFVYYGGTDKYVAVAIANALPTLR